MNTEMYVERNDALRFAERTRVNLEFIEDARTKGSNVHEVTQIANSLLGLVVFVWEKEFVKHMTSLHLGQLMREGWPRIEVTKDEGNIKTKALHDFVYHLRNAVAHGRVTFSSDSPDPRQVTIQIEDCKPGRDKPYWSAHMRADDLKKFCLKHLTSSSSVICMQ